MNSKPSVPMGFSQAEADSVTDRGRPWLIGFPEEKRCPQDMPSRGHFLGVFKALRDAWRNNQA
jgi:hypothetical protein